MRQAALGNKICQQAHFCQRPALIAAKRGYLARDRNTIANLQIVQRRPAMHSQERMMARYLDFATCARAHAVAGLDATVDPRTDLGRAHVALLRYAVDARQTLLHTLLDGQALASVRIVD